MERQHQGMDRPGVRQVPEGSGEQGKMEKTGCEIICGAPTTLAVKEQKTKKEKGLLYASLGYDRKTRRDEGFDFILLREKFFVYNAD